MQVKKFNQLEEYGVPILSKYRSFQCIHAKQSISNWNNPRSNMLLSAFHDSRCHTHKISQWIVLCYVQQLLWMQITATCWMVWSHLKQKNKSVYNTREHWIQNENWSIQLETNPKIIKISLTGVAVNEFRFQMLIEFLVKPNNSGNS